MTTTDTARREALIQLWIDRAERQRATSECRISDLAFDALRRGAPVPIEEIGAAMEMDEAAFADTVARMVAQGRLTVDDSGELITGAHGLSVVPSRHALICEGRRFFTWCALDAVGIPAALGIDARIESRFADTGEALWIEIEAGQLKRASHDELPISLVPPDRTRSLCDGICADIAFYASAALPSGHIGTAATLQDMLRLGHYVWAAAAAR